MGRELSRWFGTDGVRKYPTRISFCDSCPWRDKNVGPKAASNRSDGKLKRRGDWSLADSIAVCASVSTNGNSRTRYKSQADPVGVSLVPSIMQLKTRFVTLIRWAINRDHFCWIKMPSFANKNKINMVCKVAHICFRTLVKDGFGCEFNFRTIVCRHYDNKFNWFFIIILRKWMHKNSWSKNERKVVHIFSMKWKNHPLILKSPLKFGSSD